MEEHNQYEDVPDTTSPGTITLKIPCGPVFKHNLISALDYYGPRAIGPGSDIFARLLAAARNANYEERR